MSTPQQPLITIPLDDLIQLIMDGDVNTARYVRRELPKDTALILQEVLKNRLDWKIDFNPADGSSGPYMWKYNDWYEDYQRWLKRKEQSEKERVERWIKEENLRRITKGLMRKQCLDEKYARRTAESLLEKGAGLEILGLLAGITKLVEKENEL